MKKFFLYPSLIAGINLSLLLFVADEVNANLFENGRKWVEERVPPEVNPSLPGINDVKEKIQNTVPNASDFRREISNCIADGCDPRNFDSSKFLGDTLGLQICHSAYDLITQWNPGQGKALTRDQKAVLQPHFGNIVNQVSLHWSARLPPNGIHSPDAQAFGNHIYFKMPEGNPFDHIVLIAHELTHTEQYNRSGGLTGFCKKYAQEFLTTGGSYDNMPLENEARHRESEFARDFANKYPCGFNGCKKVAQSQTHHSHNGHHHSSGGSNISSSFTSQAKPASKPVYLYQYSICHDDGSCERFDPSPEGTAKYNARLREIQLQKQQKQEQQQQELEAALEANRQEALRKFEESKKYGLRIANQCEAKLTVNLRYTKNDGKLKSTRISKLKAGKVKNIKSGLGIEQRYILIDKSLPLYFHASSTDQPYVWDGNHEYTVKKQKLPMRKVAFSQLNQNSEGINTLFLDCSEYHNSSAISTGAGPQYPSPENALASNTGSQSAADAKVSPPVLPKMPNQAAVDSQGSQATSLNSAPPQQLYPQQPTSPSVTPQYQQAVAPKNPPIPSTVLPPHLKLIGQPVTPVTPSEISYMNYVLKRLDWNTLPTPTSCAADPSSYVTIKYGVLAACVQGDNFHQPGKSFRVQ